MRWKSDEDLDLADDLETRGAVDPDDFGGAAVGRCRSQQGLEVVPRARVVGEEFLSPRVGFFALRDIKSDMEKGHEDKHTGRRLPSVEFRALLPFPFAARGSG
mgnify:CR=1 FL=1